MVVLAGDPGAIKCIDRRRIAITDPAIQGASQPYHFAQKQKLPEPGNYLANCEAASERLAQDALGVMLEELRRREYAVTTCAIVLASGRALPSVSEILISHALIHAAEGEFFRRAFWKAAERLGIAVTGIRERELEERGEALFGEGAAQACRDIAALGLSMGPPWTTDQKTASLAAWLGSVSESKQSRRHAASGSR